MKTSFELIAEFREDQGKGARRRLRHLGKVPAILYGGRRDARTLLLDHTKLAQVMDDERFYSTILSLRVGGQDAGRGPPGARPAACPPRGPSPDRRSSGRRCQRAGRQGRERRHGQEGRRQEVARQAQSEGGAVPVTGLALWGGGPLPRGK